VTAVSTYPNILTQPPTCFSCYVEIFECGPSLRTLDMESFVFELNDYQGSCKLSFWKGNLNLSDFLIALWMGFAIVSMVYVFRSFLSVFV
jgi:hypothetical protein